MSPAFGFYYPPPDYPGLMQFTDAHPKQQAKVVAIMCRGNGAQGYVKGTVTYLVTDDLTVKPVPALSVVSLIAACGKPAGALEEKVVQLTCNEGVKLLKAAWQSKTVLTDVFLKKEKKTLLKTITHWNCQKMT